MMMCLCTWQVLQELIGNEKKSVSVMCLCTWQVLQELIGNEKKFVSVMEQLLQTYLAPLEAYDGLYV